MVEIKHVIEIHVSAEIPVMDGNLCSYPIEI